MYPCRSADQGCTNLVHKPGRRCRECYLRAVRSRAGEKKTGKPALPLSVRDQARKLAQEADDLAPPPEELFRRAEGKQARRRLRQNVLDLVMGERPVAICVMADVHLGSPGTDYTTFFRHCRVIRQAEGMHVVFGGDMVDNFIVSKLVGLAAEQEPLDEQWDLFRAVLTFLDPRLIAVVSGNHELWTHRLARFDRLGDMVRHRGLVYDQHELILRLKVGHQDYTGVVRHKFWGVSKLNNLNVCWRLYSHGPIPFDFGWVGHSHQGACGIQVFHGLPRYGFVSGSYKISDDFAQRLGFQPARPISQAVILMPDRREILPFENVERAAEYLAYLREKG